jgi:hypothetical protein
MKTEVYSWRLSTDVKTELEREARRRNISLSAALDLAACEWLRKRSAENNRDEEQTRLQKAASKCFGAFEGGSANRAENARGEVRRRLRQPHGR